MAATNTKFGQYNSVGEFLESYNQASRKAILEEMARRPRHQQPDFLESKKNQHANVTAQITERQRDDINPPNHYQFRIKLLTIVDTDDAIKKEVNDCLNNETIVQVAARFGDSLGIEEPITAGLDSGDEVHLKGVWIPLEEVRSNGGERIPVLHFTHHDQGFTCTSEKCYS